MNATLENTTTTTASEADLAYKAEIESLKLERETCSRCGGTGNYSFCLSYGTTCFKCAGKKVVLTKRGAAASAYLRAIRSKPAGEIKIGDTIKVGAVTFGGTPYDTWVKVTEIKPEVLKGASMVNGVMVPYETPVLAITGVRKGNAYGTWKKAEDLIEVGHTREGILETLRKAKEYEGTLTKTGTPRKIKAKKS